VTDYLLDSTVIIDFINDVEGAGDLVERLFATGGALLTCDVVTCEALSSGSEEERRAAARLLDALDYVATDPDAARWAAEARHSGRARGAWRYLGDALIAGVARRNDATVVTRNPRDFERQGIPVLAY
jgi:predicted nucleic acid-binding protein